MFRPLCTSVRCVFVVPTDCAKESLAMEKNKIRATVGTAVAKINSRPGNELNLHPKRRFFFVVIHFLFKYLLSNLETTSKTKILRH